MNAHSNQLKTKLIIALSSLSALLLSTPALAHHAFGGRTPANAVEGFLSGLAHPVIGLDHLAFVIAAGLLAAVMGRGLILPVVFVLASLAGTGVHLMRLDLPAPEFFISASVLLFGILLAMRHKPNSKIVIALAAVAGLFHGYAYGESIVGADMEPLVAYLLGFATVKMAMATGAYWVGQRLGAGNEQGALNLQFAGFTLAGVGVAFLSRVVLG
jgi:urease accessory protein